MILLQVQILEFFQLLLLPSNACMSASIVAIVKRNLWKCFSDKFIVCVLPLCSKCRIIVGFGECSIKEILIRDLSLSIGFNNFISWNCAVNVWWFEIKTFVMSSIHSSENFSSLSDSDKSVLLTFFVLRKVSNKIFMQVNIIA